VARPAAAGQRTYTPQASPPRRQPPPGPPPRQSRPAPRPAQRRLPVLRLAVAAVTIFGVITGWSIGHSLTAPGGGSALARIAEWARDHGMGPLVTFGEWLQYNPPKVGGKPSVSFNKLGGTTVHLKADKKHHAGLLPIIPANLGSPAGRPLPGEGVWKAVVSVKGIPAVFKTYVRQSRIYSSYYVGIVSMDQRLVKFDLRPGSEDPGPGNWGVPMDVPPGGRKGLVATFNSGFKIASAEGGFYLNGHYDGSLVKGAASEVFYRNGRLAIGAWGYGGLRLGPQVAAVRQNLKLILVNGKIPASVDQNVLSNWGATLGGSYYVWRSGIGITKDGRIIYVYGPALDVKTLASMLQRAGAVTGMELDINPYWMSFMYYLPKGNPNDPTPVNLLPGQMQPANRYYSTSSRDFTAVFAR
jgi:hypothetical protein